MGKYSCSRVLYIRIFINFAVLSYKRTMKIEKKKEYVAPYFRTIAVNVQNIVCVSGNLTVENPWECLELDELELEELW